MQRLANAARPNETGGAIVGYATVDHGLVVTAASGPGPLGHCTPESVTIDGAHTTEFTAQHIRASKGRFQFLGDWHVHTTGFVTPSPRDYDALRRLPRASEYGYRTVSLILNAAMDEALCLCIDREQLVAQISCSLLDR